MVFLFGLFSHRERIAPAFIKLGPGFSIEWVLCRLKHKRLGFSEIARRCHRSPLIHHLQLPFNFRKFSIELGNFGSIDNAFSYDFIASSLRPAAW